MVDAARTLVMGVVNVTPDSFSDGGCYLTAEHAIARARQLVAEGADLVDIGGESTRPGAERPTADDELARVLPVVETLIAEGITVSVDTMRASVALATAAAGAAIINDVSGGLADPEMLPAVAGLNVDYVTMHWRGFGDQMNENAVYGDVVTEVLAELLERVEAAEAAGIAPERVIVDPGFGFAKDADHNWALLRALPQFMQWGHRMLVGVSRKRFLGSLLADERGPRPPLERDAATAAVTALVAAQGVWAVRTHTARDHKDAIEVARQLANC